MDYIDFDIEYDSLNEDQKILYDCVGEMVFKRIINVLGGGDIYIPLRKSLSKLSRNEQIKRDFDGDNYKELAKKYKLTTRTIRGIVDKRDNNIK